MTPLHVAIVWHMHQPYYRQPHSNVAILPWTRLHATKDYLHMAQVIELYPDLHATFTMVPSMAEQLRDYAAGALSDRLMSMAVQPYFSPDDKRYLLNICFSIDWNNIIRRYPPYAALLDRRHLALLNHDYFSEQMYRDLIVWFHMAWTDPNLLESDALFSGLIEKGGDFSVAEAEAVIQHHIELLGQVIPIYRRLQNRGQLELMTVPYYHPILPLLVNSDFGRRPSPGLALPDPPFQYGIDAAQQITEAVSFHTELMGQPPLGMWPSEGAVAPEILPLAAAEGIRWLATDEAILGRSKGIYFARDGNDFLERPDILYRPYRYKTEKGDLTIIFRDHSLSDRIGFVYRHLGGEQAAEDMVVRLKRIQYQLRYSNTPALVSVILDGENAWEHYEHNGDVFLHGLYRRLIDDPDLIPVTISKHLEAFPAESTLDELASGSWIMGDFTTWIGDPEQNEAWVRLRELRRAFEGWLATQPPQEAVDEVRRYLQAAEGSDWFWWYSHRNSSDQDALYDQAFLEYLQAAYQGMNIQPPRSALTPIQGMAATVRPVLQPISPTLTADPDPSVQWAHAQVVRPTASTGTMQQAGGLLNMLRYGNDCVYLFLRIEIREPISLHHIEIDLQRSDGEYLWSFGQDQSTAFLYQQMNGDTVSLGPAACVITEGLLETAIPLARLNINAGADESQLHVRLRFDPHSDRSQTFPVSAEHIQLHITIAEC